MSQVLVYNVCLSFTVFTIVVVTYNNKKFCFLLSGDTKVLHTFSAWIFVLVLTFYFISSAYSAACSYVHPHCSYVHLQRSLFLLFRNSLPSTPSRTPGPIHTSSSFLSPRLRYGHIFHISYTSFFPSRFSFFLVSPFLSPSLSLSFSLTVFSRTSLGLFQYMINTY